MFITAALCLAVLMLAAEKHIATPFAPVGVLCPHAAQFNLCLLSTMADRGDIGRYWSHSLRVPPVSSGVIHLNLHGFGSEPPWHANMLADGFCVPFTSPTDAYALMLVCAVATFPNGRRLPDFRNPMVSAPQVRSALHGCWYEHRALFWPRRSNGLSIQFAMDRKFFFLPSFVFFFCGRNVGFL